MTRRCAKSIVHRANRFVEELTALPDAPEGQVYEKVSKGQFFSDHLDKILNQYGRIKLGPNDLMVICPTNAPLISMMFNMQKRGIKSYINGGDITGSMMTFVKKHMDQGMSVLRVEVQRKLDQIGNRKNSTSKQNQLDLYEALDNICMECTTADLVVKSINNMFSDVRRPGWIELSSIHKAKGREADTIVIWNIDRCQSPYSELPWQFQQDRNLEYVATTRAKRTLYCIRSK